MSKNSTPQIPDPIAALAEVTGRLVPFDEFPPFVGLSETGKQRTQATLRDLARDSRLQDEDEGGRSLHIVTNRGEATGQGREQIVALRTPTGKVLVVQQYAATTGVIQSGRNQGQRYPRYEVVALAEVAEDEAVTLLRDVRHAQATNDAVVSEGYLGMAEPTGESEADQVPAL